MHVVTCMQWSKSCSVVSDSLQPHGLYNPWNSPGQNTGVGSLSLLQGIFPTQGLNPGLLHCRKILYQLGHKGSPVTCIPIGYTTPRVNPDIGYGLWVIMICQCRFIECNRYTTFRGLVDNREPVSVYHFWGCVRIPGTGEPGGLSSMGSHRVGHDWSDLAAVAAARTLYFTCNSAVNLKLFLKIVYSF